MAKKDSAVKNQTEDDTFEMPSVPKLPSFGTFVNSKSAVRLIKRVKPTSYTQISVVLLIIASFLIGVLYTKVQYLEGNGGTAGVAAGTPAGTAPAAGAITPGAKVDVAVGHLPALGDKNAKVTVIEFADFQCPFCEQWFSQTWPSIKKDYVDTGKVQFYFRQWPFLGDESTWSADASECANEQGKFWDFHDYLYTHQGQENSGAFTKEKLEGFAAALGLDTAKFNSCLDSDKYAEVVKKDLTDGQAAGVSGTPTVFVNGQSIVGAEPYATFKTIIDQELAK